MVGWCGGGMVWLCEFMVVWQAGWRHCYNEQGSDSVTTNDT